MNKNGIKRKEKSLNHQYKLFILYVTVLIFDGTVLRYSSVDLRDDNHVQIYDLNRNVFSNDVFTDVNVQSLVHLIKSKSKE